MSRHRRISQERMNNFETNNRMSRANRRLYQINQFVDFENPLEDEPYFHGFFGREACERHLETQPHGSFLVRKTLVHSQIQTVISVRGVFDTYHYIIRITNKKRLFWIYQYAFKTIQNLIHFYVTTKTPLKGIPMTEQLLFECSNMNPKEMKKTQLSLMKRIEPELVRLVTPAKKSKFFIKHEKVIQIKKIGEGQFGDVYVGYLVIVKELPAYKKVAIKKLHNLNFSAQDRASFLLEAEIMISLNHENVIRMYGMTMARDPLMLVMELCKTSMESLITETELPFSWKVKLLWGASKGMAYLHELNIIHRDIAARNCLIGLDMEVKISDFGLSVIDSSRRGLSLRKGGRLPIRYMAPETLRFGKYSAATDVYSFGAMIYEVFHKCAEPFGEYVADGNVLKKAFINRNITLHIWERDNPPKINFDPPPLTQDLLEPNEKMKKIEKIKKSQIKVQPKISREEAPENEEEAKQIEFLFNACREYSSQKRARFIYYEGYNEHMILITAYLENMYAKYDDKVYRNKNNNGNSFINNVKKMFRLKLE